MIRLPAVAGQFYPASPRELSSLIHQIYKREWRIGKSAA